VGRVEVWEQRSEPAATPEEYDVTTPRSALFRRARRVTMLGALAGAVALAAPGSAAPGTVAAAGPYAQAAGYSTPTVVLPAGGELSFANSDPLSSHNLVSTKMRKIRHGKHTVRKPLFASSVTGTGTVVPVTGTANLKPGTYSFMCTLHAGTMKGTLVVQ
jgi:plastocyanin